MAVEVEFIAGVGHHDDAGVDDRIVPHLLLLLAQFALVGGDAEIVVFDGFDPEHELFPPALVLLVRFQDGGLVVADQIVGQIGAEVVEGGGVGSHPLDVVALVVDVDLLHPAFGLHRCLYHLEDSSDVGDVLYQRFYLLDLRTVLVEEFVHFVHQVWPVFLHYHVLEILEFYAFVLDFVQIFGRNIVLLHLRRQVIEVQAQFGLFQGFQLHTVELLSELALVVGVLMLHFLLELIKLVEEEPLERLHLLVVVLPQLNKLFVLTLKFLNFNLFDFQQLVHQILVLGGICDIRAFYQFGHLLHFVQVLHAH